MYDNNAESMVLATLVKRPDYSLSSEKLLPEYFHDKFNEAIYYGICELYKNKIKNIDFASLDAVIKTKYGENVLNPTQCSDFLDMANEFARDTLEEYKLFVDNIVTAAYKRELFRKTEEIQRACLKNDSKVLDVQEKMRELTMQLTEKFSVGEEDRLFGDVVQEMWETSRKKLKENDGQYGIPSKFTKLNEYCPFIPSELVVVAAKRKEGKSAYCLSECLDKLEKNYNVLYLDTELRSSQFFERILSNKARVDNYNLRSNNMSIAETDRVADAIQWFKSNKNLTHIYRPRWNQEQIYSAVLYWSQKWNGKIDLLIYDYMKTDSGATDASSAYLGLGRLTNFLKNDIAGAFDIPVLAAAQLNRGLDIGDSYQIEQFASTIINIQKKTPKEIENDNALGYNELGLYKIFVKANRNGESMEDIRSEYIDLGFEGKYFNFTNIANSPINHFHGTPYD